MRKIVIVFKNDTGLKEDVRLSDDEVQSLGDSDINKDDFIVSFYNDDSFLGPESYFYDFEKINNNRNDYYIVLHESAIDNMEGSENEYRNYFRNVIKQSHTDSFYKNTIPRIISKECTFDEIKEYFNSKTELDYKKIEEKYLKGIEITDKDLKNLNC